MSFVPELATHNATRLILKKKKWTIMAEPVNLIKLIDDLKIANGELKEARRAALNMMEDALLSKEALRKSEEKYRLKLEQEVRERTAEIKEQSHHIKRITETVPDMISVTNLETGEFEFLNTEIFIAQGFDPVEMKNSNRDDPHKYVHPDDRSLVIDYFQKFPTASDDDVVTAEYRAKGSSSEWYWFFVRGRVFQRNKKGAVTHILNVIENITDRKTAELEVIRLKDEVAQKATDKYLELYNAIDEAFSLLEVMYDDDGKAVDMRFLDVNPAVEKHTGIKVEIGKTFRSYYPALEIDTYRWCEDVVQHGVPVRFTGFSKATGRWNEYHAVRIGTQQDNQVALLFNDITEHKRNEQNQSLLAEISQELITLTTVEETFQRLGEKLGSYFGVTQCLFFELSDGVELVTMLSGWSADRPLNLQSSYRLKDFLSNQQIAACTRGKTIVVNDTGTDIPGRAENFEARNVRSFIINPLVRDNEWKFLISIVDRTPRQWRMDEINLVSEIANRIWIRLERARAEEALRISEARLKATMDSATEYAIITTDTEGIVELWSSGAEIMFGYSPEEITGRSADVIFTPEDRENNIPQKEMETAGKTGKANDERWHLDKQGTRFFVSGVMAPIYDATLTGFVKVARDITERKLLEQQKDEFIAVASHELKTPVTSIKAYTELLMEILNEDGGRDDIQLVSKLDAQVDRLTELIRSLLDTTVSGMHETDRPQDRGAAEPPRPRGRPSLRAPRSENRPTPPGGHTRASPARRRVPHAPRTARRGPPAGRRARDRKEETKPADVAGAGGLVHSCFLEGLLDPVPDAKQGCALLGQGAHPFRRDLDEPLRAATAPGIRITHSANQIALALEAIKGGVQRATVDRPTGPALELTNELRTVSLLETQRRRQDEVFELTEKRRHG
jgi:PAS domain S-box-containing protein